MGLDYEVVDIEVLRNHSEWRKGGGEERAYLERGDGRGDGVVHLYKRLPEVGVHGRSETQRSFPFHKQLSNSLRQS